MRRIYSLSLAAFLLCAACLPAGSQIREPSRDQQPAGTPLPGGPSNAPVIKLIHVRYNQKLLQLPLPPLQVTFWEQYRAFYPGILEVSPLPDIHGLIVRAKTEDDIDQFEQLVSVMDAPAKQVALRVILVKMGIAGEMTLADAVIVKEQPGNEKDLLQEALAKLIAAKKAVIISAPVLVTEDSGHITLNFSRDPSPIPALSLGVIVLGDGTLKLQVILPPNAPPFPGALCREIRVANNRMTILASGIPLEEKGLERKAEGVIVVTPVLLDKLPGKPQQFFDVVLD